jgi:hypothetical protein
MSGWRKSRRRKRGRVGAYPPVSTPTRAAVCCRARIQARIRGVRRVHAGGGIGVKIGELASPPFVPLRCGCTGGFAFSPVSWSSKVEVEMEKADMRGLTEVGWGRSGGSAFPLWLDSSPVCPETAKSLCKHVAVGRLVVLGSCDWSVRGV